MLNTRSMIFFYASTIFLSAFLLFAIQPMMGKMILPWFGGSAAVWTTCLVFFQALLLLGYVYAHWSMALRPKTQGLLHLALLAISLLALPVAPSAGWKPTGLEDPTWYILGLLTVTLGLPYLLLSATSPLLQAWYTQQQPSATPYRWFALSNLGSLLALLTYPILIEPLMPTWLQSVSWSVLYTLFIVLCGTIAWRSMQFLSLIRGGGTPVRAANPGIALCALWIGLATCPSVLLLAITSHLTVNIAPIPFLWILPLTLYLLSFILCFESSRWYRRTLFMPLCALALGGMAYAVVDNYSKLDFWIMLPLFLSGLFIVAMTCHGELAALKPPPHYLTTFYLMIATGGLLGGLGVGLVAPHVFNANYELALGLVATVGVILTARYRDPTSRLYHGQAKLRWAAVLVLTCGLTGALAYHAMAMLRTSKLVVRNFYGTLRVHDSSTAEGQVRELKHGTILHGAQPLDPVKRRQPQTYYTYDSGVGLAILGTRTQGPQRVGIVGLGAGTLAAYGRRGDYYRFYDINPLVIQIAYTEFTFLRDSAATIDVILGDARLALEREAPQNFDVLVLDAFAGDTIPMHLLTREAFAAYFKHLKPDGVLAVLISNRYLDLRPVVQQAADFYAKEARLVDTEDDDDDDEDDVTPSSMWVLVSSAPGFFAQELLAPAQEIPRDARMRPWTDDFSSLYHILQ